MFFVPLQVVLSGLNRGVVAIDIFSDQKMWSSVIRNYKIWTKLYILFSKIVSFLFCFKFFRKNLSSNRTGFTFFKLEKKTQSSSYFLSINRLQKIQNITILFTILLFCNRYSVYQNIWKFVWKLFLYKLLQKKSA